MAAPGDVLVTTDGDFSCPPTGRVLIAADNRAGSPTGPVLGPDRRRAHRRPSPSPHRGLVSDLWRVESTHVLARAHMTMVWERTRQIR